MADFKIFNPETTSANISLDKYVSDLPIDILNTLRLDLESAFLANGSSRDDALASIQVIVGHARIKDLPSYGIDVAPAMDAWAAELSFDPNRITVPQAAWILQDESGRQAIIEAHLQFDDKAINGASWVVNNYQFLDSFECWQRFTTPQYFSNYQNANQVIDGVMSLDLNEAAVRIPVEWLDVEHLGVGAYGDLLHGRAAEPSEIKMASSIDWNLEDLPEFPTFDQVERSGNVLRATFGVFDLEAPVLENPDGSCVLHVNIVNSETNKVVYGTVDRKLDSLEEAYNAARVACSSGLLPWKVDVTEQPHPSVSFDDLFPHPSEFKALNENYLLWEEGSSRVELTNRGDIWVAESTLADTRSPYDDGRMERKIVTGDTPEQAYANTYKSQSMSREHRAKPALAINNPYDTAEPYADLASLVAIEGAVAISAAAAFGDVPPIAGIGGPAAPMPTRLQPLSSVGVGAR